MDGLQNVVSPTVTIAMSVAKKLSREHGVMIPWSKIALFKHEIKIKIKSEC